MQTSVETRFQPRALESMPAPSQQASHDLFGAVVSARRAQRHWGKLPLRARVRAMRAAAREMVQRRNEAVELCNRDIGKLECEGLMSEALGPLDQLSAWSKVVSEHLERRHARLNPLAFPKKRAYTDLVPRGVIGIIAPWNYPLANSFRSVFPALLCGNAVILKPSEHAPETARWLVEILGRHLPADLVQLAPGDGRVGQALLESGIDACVFTGSVATGRSVAVRCAELGIPVSAELGGKDPAIVLADADLDRTAAGITHWALHNSGQSCGAIELVLVDRAVADSFVERLQSAWSRLRLGPGGFAEVDVPPLAHAAQLELVRAHVEDAVAAGAELVTGGSITTDLWFQPTILDHCTPEMRVVREETFGPVLAVLRVDGADQAIRTANALSYGLTASIWSRDYARAERLAERLDYGTVTINNHSFTGAIPALPWSGTRDSGTGIANSSLSLTTFVRPRVLAVDQATRPEPFWMPFDRNLWDLGDILADSMLGHIERAWRIPGLLRKRQKRIATFFAAHD